MSVVIETTIGDITVDLYIEKRRQTCLNFIKLCKIKYYNLCLFHKIEKNFIALTGDPSGTGRNGESVFCHLYGDQAKYFDAEFKPRLKHEKRGTLSMVNNGNNMNGSQFFFTLAENLTYLDEKHTVFGEVVEGFDVLGKLNDSICDNNNRPYQDIRITHTVILHDPFEDPKGLEIPDRSPEPSKEMLESGYIRADEEIDDSKGKSIEEIEEKIKESEAKARATILEMVGDIPDADVKPPENVLFVCKLNPVTTSEDLEVIFSRFGPILSCEVIKDKKTGESLQYAFIEFEKEEDCENAYFKMGNVLIDDRRIHVDFSQSVSKLNWNKNSNKGFKSQNIVVKDRSKRADGYDLIFDMDDNKTTSAEGRHTTSKSKTSDNRTSSAEGRCTSKSKTSDNRTSSAEGRRTSKSKTSIDKNKSYMKHKNSSSKSEIAVSSYSEERNQRKEKKDYNDKSYKNVKYDKYSEKEQRHRYREHEYDTSDKRRDSHRYYKDSKRKSSKSPSRNKRKSPEFVSKKHKSSKKERSHKSVSPDRQKKSYHRH